MKTFTIIFFILMNSMLAFAQQRPFHETYQHSIGLRFSLYYSDNVFSNPLSTVNYTGRFTFLSLGEEAGISAGLSPSAFFFITPGGTLLHFSLPVFTEYNIGHEATIDASRDLGALMGGGYEFQFFSNINHVINGPFISAGIRGRFLQRSTTIRIARMHDLSIGRNVIHSLSISTNLQ